MAGGPIFPHSMYLGSASGNLFPNFYAGGGGNNSAHDEGIGVAASLGAGGGTAELRYLMPPSIPTGTMNLYMPALANATTGGGIFTVYAACINMSSSPSAATLTSQITSNVQWNTGNADQYRSNKTTFPTITPVADQVLVVALAFQSGGGVSPAGSTWTLAQVSTWQPAIIWE